MGDPTCDLEMPLIISCNLGNDDAALGSGRPMATCMWQIAAMYTLIDEGANPD